jgi:hypothetical protein
MLELLLAGWLALPIAPLNPIKQDTLDVLAFHVTAGVHAANSVVRTGPDLSAKMEMLTIHPLVLRAFADYRFGEIRNKSFPSADMQQGMVGAEAIYYRGTNRLTGYLGFGVLYAFGDLSPTQAASDSLLQYELVDDIDYGADFGYRITLGLRFRQKYSLEIAVTELRPDIVYHRQFDPANVTSEYKEEFRNSTFKITLGYVFTLVP